MEMRGIVALVALSAALGCDLEWARFGGTGASALFRVGGGANFSSASVGVDFPCDELLAGLGAASCYWVNETVIVADATRTDLVTGSEVSLNGCAVEMETLKLLPEVILEGPSVIDICQDLSIKAEASLGHGGRDFVDFHWNLTGTKSSYHMFDASALEVPSSSLSAWYAKGVREVVIELSLRNVFGFNATSLPFHVLLVDAGGVVELSVVGGLAQTVRRDKPLVIEILAKVPTCVDRPDSGLTYAYALSPGNFSSTTSDPRRFQLPAFTLTADPQLIVTATDKFTGISVNATVAIRVIDADLVAIISGPTEVAFNESIVLTAAQSYDENAPYLKTDGLSFQWSCNGTTTTSIATRVNGSDAIGDSIFCLLRVTKDNRTITATRIVKVIAKSPKTFVDIVGPLQRTIASTSRFVVTGRSRSSSVTTWVKKSGSLRKGLGLEAYAATPLVSRSEVNNLVLPVGALVQGGHYSFALTTTFSSAQIDVIVPFGPKGGTLEAEPSSGVALETLFQFTTRHWAAAELPLRYAYRAYDDAELLGTLRFAGRNPSLSTVLPALDSLRVEVTASDALGSAGTVSIVVEVAEFSNDTLLNRTKELIKKAALLYSDEGICQVAVASATNDTELLEVLVDAMVDLVIGTQDKTTEAVEQSATALMATTMFPDFLSARAASRALDGVFQLVPSNDGDPLSAIATEAIATIWSNLLASPLLTAEESATLSAATAMTAALDGMLATILRGLVQGENPAAVAKSNFRALAAITQPQQAIALPLPNSTARLDLPASETQKSSLAVTIVELLLNPYAGLQENQSIASNILRLGVSSSLEARRNVTVDVTMPKQTTFAAAAEPGAVLNLTCSCGFYGNVSGVCPDGTVLSKGCDGMPGTYAARCPMTAFGTSCSARIDDTWQSTACEVLSTSPTTTCRCLVENGASNDYSTNLLSRREKVVAQYFSNVVQGVDARRALYMFLTLGAWLCLFVCLVAYGRRLDDSDAKALKTFKLGHRSTTIGRVVTARSSGRIHEIQWAHGKKADDKNKMHPIFLNERMRLRYYVALAHQHPLANWWLCHSPNVPRSIRVIALAFEILCYFFALALEVNLVYYNANCTDQNTRSDCLQFRTASWTGGTQMCAWENCRCESQAPSFGSTTSDARQYLVLAVVIAITFPILRLFEIIFQRILLAPCPDNVRSLFRWRKDDAAGGPLRADDADGVDDLPPGDRENKEDSPPLSQQDADKSGNKTERIRRKVSSFAESTIRRGSTALKGLVDEGFTRHFQYAKRQLPQRRCFLWLETTKVRLAALVRSLALHYSQRKQTAPLRDEARTYAPVVIGQVIRQLEELEDLVETIRQKKDQEAAAQRVLELASDVRRRWHWSPDYAVFRANVEEKLFGELHTAHQWRRDLQKMRDCLSPEAYGERSLLKLKEYERVSRMSLMERLVFEACMERANFVIEAPLEPVSPVTYCGAWIGTVACVSGICYYLLSTASSLGKAQSKLWLAHLSISFFVSFVVILPVSIFVFYVWLPDLIYDRLMLRFPGSLHKLPTKSQPPYALRFLLDIEPDLRSEKASRVVYGLHKDKTEALAAVALEHMDRIYHYEKWRPAADTRFLVFAAGLFSALPCYLQNVLFEEVISVVPYLASLVTATHLQVAFLPRSLSVAVVMVLTLTLLASVYGLLEALRFLIRRLAPTLAVDALLEEDHADTDSDDDDAPPRKIIQVISKRLSETFRQIRRHSSLLPHDKLAAVYVAGDTDDEAHNSKETNGAFAELTSQQVSHNPLNQATP